jgi:hypothetical protein
MSKPSSIILRAGRAARAHIAAHGLQGADIQAVPAAAGGPKGLALIPLDQYLFGEFLRDAPASGQPRWLVGSSVGSWRMCAAAQADPVRALERMREGYFSQRYPQKPSGAYVSMECGKTAQAALGDSSDSAADWATDWAGHWSAQNRLVVITARSRGLLREKGSAARLAAAALTNTMSRARLASFFERVLFANGPTSDWAAIKACLPVDRFGSDIVELSADNAPQALLASGTIPMLADPVRSPTGAPPGLYWDGGMVDYHIDWHWNKLPGLVLYPHFVDYIVPGWLDKHLAWRRARGAHLDNVLLISPSPDLLARLPRRKLPDREDFYHYGLDHDARVADWRLALGECERMAEDFARFVERPDVSQLVALD